MFAAGVAIYVLAVFHRSSLGVAGLLAADRFEIAATQLSVFTMVQLFVYAAMQIPVGALLDRFGAKRLLIAGVTTMTLAQFAFAFAESFQMGILARVAVGVGDAMVFIPLLRLVALWFPPVRIPMVTQLTGLLGQMGALVAASPLVAALHHWGWTPSFATAAGVGVLLGVVLVLVVRDSPNPDHELDDIKVRALARALPAAWVTPGTRLGLWSHFTVQFGATVFALLWGYPFFVYGEHTGTAVAGSLLTLLVVTSMVGGPLIGAFISRHPWHRSTLVLSVVLAMMLTWAVVLLYPGDAPLWLLAPMVVASGLGGPTSMVGFDLARTFNPATRLGSATGIVNVGGFVASLVMMLAIGLLLDAQTPGAGTDYSASAYRGAMAVQYVGWVAGLALIWRYRRRARRHLAVTQPETYRAMTGRAGQTGQTGQADGDAPSER